MSDVIEMKGVARLGHILATGLSIAVHDPSAAFTSFHAGCATHKNLMLESMGSSFSGSRYRHNLLS